jgi:hypothetical protein
MREASELYNRPIIKEMSCPKLKYKRNQESVMGRIRESNIPWNLVRQYEREQLLSVRKDNNGFLWVGGTCITPMTYESHSSNLEKKSILLSLSLIYAGLRSKYFLTPLVFQKYNSWKDLLVDFGESVDFLTIARFDMGVAPFFILELLYELISFRKSQGLTTLVTVGSQPKARNDTEFALYEDMSSWGTFTELIFEK